MFRLIHSLYRQQSGATIIEFAFVLPVLLLMVMAIIEFGIIYHISSLATHAGNEAARLGKTGNSYGQPMSREELVLKTVRDTLSFWVRNPDDLVVTSTAYGNYGSGGIGGVAGAGAGGEVVLYRVTYQWQVLTPLVGPLLSDGTGSIPISAVALVKNEEF